MISLRGREADWRWQIKRVVLFLFLTMVFGTAGLMVIEGWPLLDALYMTVTTLSTVGYREVHPLSTRGMVFIIVFIIVGVGTFLYLITTTAEFIIAGHLTGALERRSMKRRIEALSDHYIICGFGRVGQQVALELEKEGVPFVVIDSNPGSIKECISKGYLYIEGSASSDEVLLEAGLMRAKGLITATNSDEENVYIVLSAKSLRSEIFVVARANLEGSEHKLRRAGADRVVSPYSIGGRRLASLLLRPSVVEFLDVVVHSKELEMMIEEVVVGEGASIAGRSLDEARIKGLTGATVLAIKKREEGGMVINPPSDTVIEKGDLLIALGTRDQLNRLKEVAL